MIIRTGHHALKVQAPELQTTLVCADVSLRPTECWRDTDGSLIAEGAIESDQAWMSFPAFAEFQFAVSGGPVSVRVRESADANRLRDTYYRSVLPMVLQVRGCEVLHASAVLTSKGVVAFCAVSGTGKSTLADAFESAGYPAWGDDAVAWRQEESHTWAVPVPFRIKLAGVNATEFRQPPFEQPLAAVCLLERIGVTEPVSLRRTEGVPAFAGLLRHAYCFSLRSGERKQQMLTRYLDLAQSVPVWDLRYPSGLDQLPKVLQAVKETVFSSPR